MAYPDPNSIVDYLKSRGMDSSLAARQKMAKDRGYTGDVNNTYAMNVWLLNDLRGGAGSPGGWLKWLWDRISLGILKR